MKTTRLLGSPDSPTLQSLGFAAQVFQHYINEKPDFHDHDIVELFWIISGEGTHYLEDEQHDLKPGDLGVIHFGQSHSIVSRTPMKIINVYINPDRYSLPLLPEPLSSALPHFLPLAPGLANRINRARQYHLGESSPISEALNAIVLESQEQRPGYQSAMSDHLRLFFLHCSRFLISHSSETERELSPQHVSVERIRKHLDESWNETVSLSKLAENARMSREHLCRIFRQYTGKSILEYIYQRRIEHALIMLDSTNEKVIHVALESGFGDLAHFNRTFKKLMGMTPSQYRKRNQN